jgi:hypothetical protein
MLYYIKMIMSWLNRYSSKLFTVGLAACIAGLCFGWWVLGTDGPGRPPDSDRQVATPYGKRPHPAQPYTFPAGGRTLAGAYRIAALYGSPDTPALGALGDQPLPASVERVKGVAAAYRPLSAEPVLPAFEIIATVASATPTDNGDYSRETDANTVFGWAEAAKQAGVYVILDIQPGRSSFLSQVKQYERALQLPNVGLALDPEWRLGPSQLPLEQIGSVESGEVNEVSDWLAALTRQHRLPQKLFVLHQFRFTMLPDRDNVNTAHQELAYIIQMDGQGSQPAKQGTWQAITANPPARTEFGWKNFYSQDSPMLDPVATMSITPKPWYISYQ